MVSKGLDYLSRALGWLGYLGTLGGDIERSLPGVVYMRERLVEFSNLVRRRSYVCLLFNRIIAIVQRKGLFPVPTKGESPLWIPPFKG